MAARLRPMGERFVRFWLVLAVLATALTLERVNALMASASVFPGISVLGIFEVLVPAEAAVLFFARWRDLRKGTRRGWGWLLLAAFASFITLLLVGAATLASRPGGLAPSGLAIVLVGVAITAFAAWRSGRAGKSVDPGLAADTRRS
jgi:hypothetical protein